KAPHWLPLHPVSRLPSASVASPSHPAPTGVCVAHAEGYAAFFMPASDPQLLVIAHPGCQEVESTSYQQARSQTCGERLHQHVACLGGRVLRVASKIIDRGTRQAERTDLRRDLDHRHAD